MRTISIQKWSANAHSLGPKRKCLDHVGPGPDATVNHDVDLSEEIGTVTSNLI